MSHEKILVALSKADTMNEQVFAEALCQAKLSGASLKLLHTLSLDEAGSPNILVLINTPEHRHQWEDFERPGLEMLRHYQSEAQAAGVATEIAQIVGKPGHTICDTARAWGADLIILGRRGLHGLDELLLGSVSNHVIHYAPCSVLLIQGKPIPAGCPADSPATEAVQLATVAV